MYVYIYVRTVDADGGAFTVPVVEIVGNSVFHPVCDEFGVPKYFGVDHGVDGKRHIGRKILIPFDLFGFGIDRIGVGGFEAADRFEDTQGGTAAEVCFIHQCFISSERDHAAACLHIGGLQQGQFIGQDVFQSLQGLGYHVELCIVAHAHQFSTIRN